MVPNNRPRRVLMNRALDLFLDEMVPYVTGKVEELSGKPIEDAAVEVFGENVGNQFLQDLADYGVNSVMTHQALSRIGLTVEFFWPMFKNTLRNRAVATGALKQIQYAAATGADHGQDLDRLYVEQRFDDMSNILGRIGAEGAQNEIEGMKALIE